MSQGCSAALKASKVVFSKKTLDAWLRNPERAIPGQKVVSQVTDAKDRASLIARWNKLSPA